ncbi:efflux transporter permease subunit [Novosphingobium nitrogenifigens DSM 19370]|uniref:Efflux transporter permease subunit n=1 Tax=Novosphingobium nitrogenifigens DSM 19370 TaxID=983920 RepID=F1ZB70_9SPHN|nr:FUSC family protein [Novosphingobium nitrogenifigens]EGD58063.1 efflux transporter permease subunit [Novosphingobium nitrogenifigens DSM 19370]
MPRIGRAEITFSLTTFAAAMLALYISFLVGLERPYWAMLTVYISSQPVAAAALSKGIFRVAGTLIGAAASVLVVPMFVDAPPVLSLVLALWVGVCLFISLLDRTPRAYLFMLAGYTAALISFPAVDKAEDIFNIAVLRGMEIAIGAACSSLLHTLIPAHDFEAAIGGRIRTVRTEMGRWLDEVLDGKVDAERPDLPSRMAGHMTELRLMATHLRFHPDGGKLARGTIMVLWDHLVLLMPLVDAIEDRLTVLREPEGTSWPEGLADVLAHLRDWVGQEPQTLSATRAGVEARLAAWHETLSPDDWRGLIALNLHARLAELVMRYEATQWLAEHTLHPATPLPAPLTPLLRAKGRRLWHRDVGLAFRSALAAVIGVLGSCAVWIVTMWPDGGTMAMICAVVCSFFATLDDPRPAQASWLKWTALSLPIAAVYLFGILPHVTTFEGLVLALAPTLLVMGVFLGDPAIYVKTMTLVVGFCGALALTAALEADFARFINSNIAQLIGAAAAIVTTGLFRVIGAEAAVQRILRRNWGDLARLAAGRLALTGEAWNSLMVDRAALLSPRIGHLASLDGRDRAAGDGLREVRIGLNLIQIRQMIGVVPADTRQELVNLQNAAAGLCHAQSLPDRTGLDEYRAETLVALRAAGAKCREPSSGSAERDLLNILVGMTRALLPEESL